MYEIKNDDCLNALGDIPDNSIDLVLSDPPYGITRNKWDSVIPLPELWQALKRVRKVTSPVVMTATQPFTTTLVESNKREFKYCWYWNKIQGTGFLNANRQPLRCIEDVVVFYAKQCHYNPQMRTGFKPYKATKGTQTSNYNHAGEWGTVSDGSRFPVTLLNFQRDTDRVHPTQKPVDLMRYLIRTYTKPGDKILDFAMGSGTTIIAAEQLKRDSIGIELDTEIYNLAKGRIESWEST